MPIGLLKAANASTTLAVLPLVLVSAAVTSYARTASHHMQAAPTTSPLERKQQQEAVAAHDAEVLHQHVLYPWKGTR